MERVVEELERQCREKINSSLRSSEDTEIQQDDSIICDVCRSVSNASYEYHLICVLFLLKDLLSALWILDALKGQFNFFDFLFSTDINFWALRLAMFGICNFVL